MVVAPGGVVCDDRPAIRRSVGALLVRCGFELAGEVETFAALHELVLRTRPAVVVLTLPLPGMGTLATVGALRREAPASEIVVLSAFETLEIAAVEAGAKALVADNDPRMLQSVLLDLAASWSSTGEGAAVGLAGIPEPRQASASDKPVPSGSGRDSTKPSS